jgi:hypothetical protein
LEKRASLDGSDGQHKGVMATPGRIPSNIFLHHHIIKKNAQTAGK